LTQNCENQRKPPNLPQNRKKSQKFQELGREWKFLKKFDVRVCIERKKTVPSLHRKVWQLPQNYSELHRKISQILDPQLVRVASKSCENVQIPATAPPPPPTLRKLPWRARIGQTDPELAQNWPVTPDFCKSGEKVQISEKNREFH